MRLQKGTPEYREAFKLWKSEGDKYDWHTLRGVEIIDVDTNEDGFIES